jgi:2-methylcitrate dehydratase PrpD
MARERFTGPKTIIEGDKGFCRATAQHFILSRVVPKKKNLPRILEVTFKHYPSCGHTHTPIDAALQIYPRLSNEWKRIRGIRIKTNTIAIRVAGNLNPETAHEAKFSIPFSIAYVLRYGHIDQAAFEITGIINQKVRSIIKLIKLEVGKEMERVFKQKRSTEMILEMDDGRKFYSRIDYRRGDPEYPSL